MSKEKETKKAAAKAPAKKQQAKKAQPNTEEKAAEPTNAYTRHFTREVEDLMQEFIENYEVDQNLTGTDRRRLTGAGVRNNGFIDKAFDIIIENPGFMPPNFDMVNLRWNMLELEDFRQLFLTLQRFTQIASNAYLVQADHCYREALRIYQTLREQANSRVPGAQPLFNALRTFFSRTRRQPADEPTYDELERDVKSLLHGKADGEIVIKNETPRVRSAVREVVDNVHRGKSAFKETVEASVDEGTSERKK